MTQDFKEKYCNRPHVVIVGAGASAAAMGRKCPTMSNAIEVIGLDSILQGVSLNTQSKNLEDIYSELFSRGDECKSVRLKLEDKLYEYFSDVRLPDTLNIYDLLVLSLRNCDCIVSFNWDSLLIQAYNRMSKITSNLPEMLFLHGNVGAGVCAGCKRFGPIQNHCPSCGRPFSRVPLLYPVAQKDYNSDIFIKDQWSEAKYYISRAAKVTVFGYSAPTSDKEASDILKAAFSKFDNGHRFDTIEIIERPNFDNSKISDTWMFFFKQTNYHYKIVDSFFKSSLAEAPRRTILDQYHQGIEGHWNFPSINFSENSSFDTIEEQVKPLLENEAQGDLQIL